MPNSENSVVDTERESRYEEHVTKCAVKSCKWESFAPNDEGALDLIVSSGYGDFTDNYDSKDPYFRLCHRHAHKFARWLNNDAILLSHNGHAHNGSEPGFWHGHIGWDQKTWTSYVTGFFYFWYAKGFRSAKYYVKRHFQSHKQWTRKDINDVDSPVILSKFFFRLFFLDNAFKGFVTKQIRNFKTARFERAEKLYRSQLSLENELWKKIANNKLSDRELLMIQAIARSSEEE